MQKIWLMMKYPKLKTCKTFKLHYKEENESCSVQC